MKKKANDKLIADLKKEMKKRRIEVERRISEFEKIGKDEKKMFYELCFCILTANYTAEGGIRIQKEIGEGFLKMNMEELKSKLRELKHRFPNKRAEYIIEARKKRDLLKELKDMDDEEAREFIVKNFKGVGYKEASHFLRNIGRKNIAIVDYHIMDLLQRYDLIKYKKEKNKKQMTRKRYMEIESLLKEISSRAKINLARLDLYLWAMETGKVLK